MEIWNIRTRCGELISQGYIAFIEFRAQDGKVSLQPDLDYVLGKRDGTITDAQMEWINSHLEEISRHQPYTVNMAGDGLFGNTQISDVRMWDFCKECEHSDARKEWCFGRAEAEPEACICCEEKK